jgi:hypothetical protein
MSKLKIFILGLCLFILNTQSKAQAHDTTGCAVIEKCLKIVDNYLKAQKPVNVIEMDALISFLTYFTGIPSKSDGSYIGQISPTKEDYENWTKWFTLNKENIFWDDKSKALILKKSMALPKSLLKSIHQE